MIKLLFVEDDPSAVENVRMLTERRFNTRGKLCNFERSEEMIASYLPHVVILDLLQGGGSGDPEPKGIDTRDFVWNSHFCPIIIYAAEPLFYQEKYADHLFVKCIKKGSKSPQNVVRELDNFQPQIRALQQAERHIRQSFACAMREVAPYAFEVHTEAEKRSETILRAGRRRLAAQMDDILGDSSNLEGWEQYLWPPVTEYLQLGDIIRERDQGGTNPSAFRLVLTPSCDLVATDDRKAKVSKVLVAKCCSMKKGLDRTAFKNMRRSKLKSRLSETVLRRGFIESIVPLPPLLGRIPTMVADMKVLHLIELKNIGMEGDEKKFVRVASIDSPFREAIAWAYLQCAGRPGVPDRNVQRWCDQILESIPDSGGRSG